MADETILNRRIKKGDAIVYPITHQENVIGLQGTIKDKLPIVSETTPQVGEFVEKQVWIDIGDSYENHGLNFGPNGGGELNFGEPSEQVANEVSIKFGKTPGHAQQQTPQDLTFGQSSVNNNENS